MTLAVGARPSTRRCFHPASRLGEQGLWLVALLRLVIRELGEREGKLIGANGVMIARLVVDDGEGFAPVALPTEEPVSQLGVVLLLAEALLL